MSRSELFYVDGLMQPDLEPRGEELTALLRHAAIHMSDRAVSQEWDSVLSLARSDSDREALNRYRHARMRTTGFNGRSWTTNSHGRMTRDWLKPKKSSARATCARTGCRVSFKPQRSTRRFCSTGCRVSGHRSPSDVTLRTPE